MLLGIQLGNSEAAYNNENKPIWQIIIATNIQTGLFQIQILGYLTCGKQDPMVYLPIDVTWTAVPIFGYTCDHEHTQRVNQECQCVTITVNVKHGTVQGYGFILNLSLWLATNKLMLQKLKLFNNQTCKPSR